MGLRSEQCTLTVIGYALSVGLQNLTEYFEPPGPTVFYAPSHDFHSTAAHRLGILRLAKRRSFGANQTPALWVAIKNTVKTTHAMVALPQYTYNGTPLIIGAKMKGNANKVAIKFAIHHFFALRQQFQNCAFQAGENAIYLAMRSFFQTLSAA